MNYQPKILLNPTNETIEFMCDSKIYSFGPGEKKIIEGFVAYHALKEVNTGLVEYEGQASQPIKSAYDKVPYRTLVSLAAAEGVYETGMKREEIEAALKELDAKEEGTL